MKHWFHALKNMFGPWVADFLVEYTCYMMLCICRICINEANVMLVKNSEFL